MNDKETLVANSNLSHIINLALNETFNEKLIINSIIKNNYEKNTYGIITPTLAEQITTYNKNNKANLTDNLLTYCKIIDYIDCVHDFRSCNKDIETILGIVGIDLCSAGSNINIDKSHSLQLYCIANMIKQLQEKGIVIPNLEDSFFLPKDKINEYISTKKGYTKFYLESGRIPDIEEKFIQPKTICAIYDGCAHAGISYADVIHDDGYTKYNNYYNGVVNTSTDNYTIRLYGNLVEAIFNPSSMVLKVSIVKTTNYIQVKLLNNSGITVNSILNSFLILNNIYINAERGGGNDDKNFEVHTNLSDNDPIYLFLATCLKTVCDKIVSTELTPFAFITDIATIDGYVWAGVTYKYIIGEYPILPTIYESVKNGWIVKPGIYDLSDEISNRIIRLMHLYVIFNNEALPVNFNKFAINPQLKSSYLKLIHNYYKVAISSITIINNITVIDNIFDFLSCIKILFNYAKINENINNLIEKLTSFFNNPTNVIDLLNIPLLEDVLKNNAIDEAMKNQQTIIYSNDIVYDIVLTPQQQLFINEFMNTYKDNINNPSSFINEQIIDKKNNCNTDLVKRIMGTPVIQEIETVCNDFRTALHISQTSSQTSSKFDFNFFNALKDKLITVSINEKLSQIIFTLNRDVIKGYSSKLGYTISHIKEWFTNSVYTLNDDDDMTYVVNKDNLTITGPIEMEILWILSIVVFSNPFVSKSERMQQAEMNKRIQTISHYGKILFDYLKPDYFTDDTYLEKFKYLYVKAIQLAFIEDGKTTSYISLWREVALPLPESTFGYSNHLQRFNPAQQLNNPTMVFQFNHNNSLPDGIKIRGGYKKASKMQQKTKKRQKSHKTKMTNLKKTNKLKKKKSKKSKK